MSTTRRRTRSWSTRPGSRAPTRVAGTSTSPRKRRFAEPRIETVLPGRGVVPTRSARRSGRLMLLATSNLSIALTSAITLTAVYGLIALGFVIVYRASGVLNFAQGAMMVLGGFLGFSLAGRLGLSAAEVYPLVAVAGFAIGWLFYLLVMPRLAGQPVWVPVL